MHHHHSTIFPLLSLVVAVLGSWTALDLFRRVQSHVGAARNAWLTAASVVMGSSIWSMHFIAMLGFDPGSPVEYDLGLTLLSLALAVLATSGAFFAASVRPSAKLIVLAGCAMGAGICIMHYVGMAALRSAVSLGYRPGFVAASFVIAVVASTAALVASRRERSLRWRLIGALTLGAAVVGMHYTAMAGLMLTPSAVAGPRGIDLPPGLLGFGVAGLSILIMLMALLASLYDQRFNVLGAIDAAGVGYWELDLPSMTIQLSPTAKAIFGKDPHATVEYADLVAALSPEDQARRSALFAAALQEGADYDVEYRLATPADRWVNVRGRVIAWRNAAPRRMSGIVVDVSDRHAAFDALAQAERRQRVMIDELNHRVKNTLAAVQSIARQTAKGALSLDSYRRSLDARLIALSETHNALTRGNWQGANLREILGGELLPYRGDRVTLDGDATELSPRAAIGLGMVFHELTTNSAKYGALADAAGALSVSWRAEGDRLKLFWREAVGTAPQAPTRSGFGSRLIKATVEGELRGRLEWRLEPTGLQCVIDVPWQPDAGVEDAGLRARRA